LSEAIGSLDLLIQNDQNPEKANIEYLCAGFMLIKSNKKTLDFFDTSKINIKGKTTDNIGTIGSKEASACQTIISLSHA